MNSSHMSGSRSKPLICIYTNNEKNEFAIGFREDENFTAVTKVGDFYTRFVDVFESNLITNDTDWEEVLKVSVNPVGGVSPKDGLNMLHIINSKS